MATHEHERKHDENEPDYPDPNSLSKLHSPPREPELEPITLTQNSPPEKLLQRREPELEHIRLSPSPEALSPLSEPDSEHRTGNPPLETLHSYNSTPESPPLDFSHHEEAESHKQPPPVKPLTSPVADSEHARSNTGSGRRVPRNNLTILKRAQRDTTIKKSLLGFRVCGFVFSLVSFSVLAADKDRGWALDSFNRYEEFRYCMAVNVIAFVYSAFQSFDLAYQLAAGDRKQRQNLRYYLDFSLDQVYFKCS